jgi:hypothetical protein
MTIPPIDSETAIDFSQITHSKDSIMEATVCQSAEIIVAEEQAEEQIVTLGSAEMSFVGGGLMQVVFA